MSSVFFYEPFYDIDRVFEKSLGGGDEAIRHFKPRMDLHEESGKNLVTATFELPGFKKEDVSIDARNGSLTVSVEIKLSYEHDEEEIKASMENGILTITFLKSTPALAAKKISIS
ncbi:hypothetical protein H1R20_g12568, partial [Candolleomyces eurysporus]